MENPNILRHLTLWEVIPLTYSVELPCYGKCSSRVSTWKISINSYYYWFFSDYWRHNVYLYRNLKLIHFFLCISIWDESAMKKSLEHRAFKRFRSHGYVSLTNLIRHNLLWDGQIRDPTARVVCICPSSTINLLPGSGLPLSPFAAITN